MEEKLARVQDALAVAEEAWWKAKAKVAPLEVKQTSLPLEIGGVKDEFSPFLSRQGQGGHGGRLLKGLGVYLFIRLRMLYAQKQHL